MSSDTVTEILEEIAPIRMRGMSISSSIESMGCAESRRTQYQGLTIDRVRNNCLSLTPEHEVRATITYKRDVCPKHLSHLTQGTGASLQFVRDTRDQERYSAFDVPPIE
jgi:hypothetical protein